MKFTDGYWRMRADVHAEFPAQAYDFDLNTNSFTVYAPTKKVAHRGDTLNATILSVEFSSPLEDIIRVRLTHRKGTPPQRYGFIDPPDIPARVDSTSEAVSLTSGSLTVTIPRNIDFRVDFTANGSPVTRSARRGMGIVEQAGRHYLHEQLSLGVGEYVYGLGERFTAFIKNGQIVDIWNADGGTSSEQTYKNVPFYLTNRGYGVLVNHSGKVSFEVASEKVTRTQFSVEGQVLEYFLIYGPTPKQILEKYTALTGRPALPPPWSFGLWLTTSFTTSYDEATVTSFIEGMQQRNLPLHVFHFDCFWMKEYHWCNFEWDSRTFPDPAAMLKRLKERGLHICVWINPYIAQRSALFDEGMQNDYLLRKSDGKTIWQTDDWQAGMAIVDFTNPAACQWYASKLRQLLDMGVDCFKTDFGERIPTDVVYFDGSDPHLMHNYYSILYNQVVFNLLEEQRGKGEAVVFARSSTAGGQQFPVHWGGDCESNFESMAESLRGGLSLTLSGFSFWSHDIGGFEGTPPAEIYKRWIPFGLLSSHSRLHGSHSYRVPWLFDQESVDVLRFFTELKCRLMPYIFAKAVESHCKGIPVMRAMLLEFPAEPTCDFLDRQYMLGENLLVAPVFSASGEVTYYLPAGRWVNFFTGHITEGARWITETHGFLSLPLMIRPNSLIPVGSHTERPDYDYTQDLTVYVCALDDGSQAETAVTNHLGVTQTTFHAERVAEQVIITCDGSASGWKVLLLGMPAVQSVQGGSFEQTSQGTTVTPAPHTKTLTITLAQAS